MARLNKENLAKIEFSASCPSFSISSSNFFKVIVIDGPLGKVKYHFMS